MLLLESFWVQMLFANGAEVATNDMWLFPYSQGLYSNMYYLNQEYHATSIKRFHSVLEANINVLDQVRC